MLLKAHITKGSVRKVIEHGHIVGKVYHEIIERYHINGGSAILYWIKKRLGGLFVQDHSVTVQGFTIDFKF